MSLLDYLNALAAKGIELWVADGKLQYKAPKELITPGLLAELKLKKAEIVAMLQELRASTGTYPLSYAQKSLWSLHQLNPQSAAYNVTYAAQLVDDLHVEALERCLDYLMARHPILRTRYAVIDGVPQQRVETAATAHFEVCRARAADVDAVRAWIDREANAPFDLAASPVRFKLLVNETHAAPAAPRYVLLLNVHHIAADFWSLEILVRELSVLYRMAVTGEPLALAPLELQYKDCVQHERERLQGPQGALLANFWGAELAGELPALRLSTDRLRPPLKTENGKVYELELDAALTQAIKRAAQTHGVTPYMWLLGVYQLFLFLHTGQEQILIGAPTAGRNLPGSETVLGHFVNTTVLRCALARTQRFVDVLASTRALMARVLDHQDYPFPLLVERLRPARDPSRAPIFQVMYNWNQARRDTRRQLEGEDVLAVKMLAASSTGTRGATHDLTLNIYDYGDRYVTAWTFNTDLYLQTTIARFALHYRTLLAQVLDDPGLPLERYSLVDADKRRRILERGRGTSGAPQRSYPPLQAFMERAEREPERLAVHMGEREWRYGDLLRAFIRLRSQLAALGVNAASRVAVDADTPGELAVIALALLDCGAAVALIGYDAGEQGAQVGSCDLIVRAGSDRVDGAADSIEIESAVADTTVPRAFYVSAVRLAAFVRGAQDILELSGASRVLLLPGSDRYLVLAQTLGTLIHGGSLYWPADSRGDAATGIPIDTLLACIERHRISAAALPQPLAPPIARAAPASLQVLALLGDSPLPPATRGCNGVRSKLLPRFALDPRAPPFHFEWREECWVLDPSVDDAIGVVLDDFRHVVDDDLSGTLHFLAAAEAARITGAIAAQDTRATPFVVKRRPDGRIVYQACATRVAAHASAPFFSDAVEACMAAQEDVRYVVCRVREVDKQPTLVAYVEWNDGDRVTAAERMREYVKRRLPEYMRPQAYVDLDAVPWTPAYSIDDERLPLPVLQARRGYVAPRNDVEAKLAELWRETLAVGQVGVHDDFFELGGDSILGAIIISKANAQRLYFSPKDIFEHHTIAALAAVVREAPAVQAEQGAVTGEAPLAPAQAWFFDKIDADISHFNQALLIQLDAVPDAARMERTLALLVQQHDVLGARFLRRDGEWRQVYGAARAAAAPPRFSVITCGDTEAAWQRAIASVQASLDIEQGELIKACWLERGNIADSRLLVVAHHLAIDGVSWSVLLEDIRDFYLQLAGQSAPQLPPKTTSYKEWAERLRAHANSAAMTEELAYWRAFGERGRQTVAPAHDVPPRGDLQGDSAHCSVALNRELTTAFRTQAQQAYRTDAADLLLAALYRAFGGWLGQPQLQVDVEGHGREVLFDGVDISRTVGWFTAIYPVLLDARVGDDKAALIKRVKQRLREVPRKGGGYGMLRYLRERASGEDAGDLPPLPPSPILFTYLGQLDQIAAAASGFYTGILQPAPAIRSSRQRRTHAFDVCAYIAYGCLTIECVYDRARYAADDVRGVLERLRDELAALIEHCLDPAAGGMTPSDMPDVDIDQDALDELLDEVALLDR